VITSWVPLPPNTQKLTTVGPAGAPGNGVKYHVQMFFIYFFVISCAALENTFWEYRHHFGVKRRVPVGIDFLRGLNFKIKNFPLLNPQNVNF